MDSRNSSELNLLTDDDAYAMPSPAGSGKSPPLQDSLTLRHVADMACKRIDIGTAILPTPLFTPDVQDYGGEDTLQDVVASMETPYARVLRQEFNAVVIEHHLKWTPLLSPTIAAHGGSPELGPDCQLGRYDFSLADSVVNWAIKHKLKVKGHVLVWHVTSPIKLLEQLDPDQVREELRQHIFTVMGHYRGRVKVWDVVNEALAPDGSLAENLFYQKLGPSYIEECFRWAHQADPDAILLYNDNKVEGVGSAKAQGLYALLADLKSKDVPIHGCGLQGHWNAAGTGANLCPTPRQVKEQIRRIGQLGLTVNLSEVDVRVSQLEDAEYRPMAQTQIYHDLVAAALTEPAFDGVWLWGFTDRHTWVTHFYHEDEPLILDEQFGRKPCYFGLRQALMTLTPQGRVGGNVPLTLDRDEHGQAWGRPWRKSGSPTDLMDDEAFMKAAGRKSQQNNGDARPDWVVESDDFHEYRTRKDTAESDEDLDFRPRKNTAESDDGIEGLEQTDLSNAFTDDSEYGDTMDILDDQAQKLPEIA